jgi:hypothetical protein
MVGTVRFGYRGFVATSQGTGYHYHPVGTNNSNEHIGQYNWTCGALQNDTISMSWEFTGVYAPDAYDSGQHAEFWVETIDYRTGTVDDLAVSVPYPGNLGSNSWPPPSVTSGAGNVYPCYRCVMKRMTSIGQSVTNTTNGDYFGPVKWSNASVTCDPHPGCQINGTAPYSSPWLPPILGACSEYPSWSGVQNGAAVPLGTSDCTTNTSGVVQTLFSDYADEVVYISMNGSQLSTQSWPFASYAPKCTPDSYGYCLDSVTRNLTKQTCTLLPGRAGSMMTGSVTDNIYSAADGFDSSFVDQISPDGEGGCGTEGTWDPGEPSAYYNDPNLP